MPKKYSIVFIGRLALGATSGSHQVSQLIIDTGLPVMAWGGFNGGDHILSITQLEAYVSSGTLTYFFIGGQQGGPGKGNQSHDIEDWVKQNGTLIPRDQWNGPEVRNDQMGNANPSQQNVDLYEVHL